MGSVTELTDSDFETFTKQSGLTLVDFWAPWCGPCKRIGPIIEQLADEMEDIRFAKINTDENQTTAAGEGVMSLPTIMIYKDGAKVDQIVGAVPKDTLVGALQKAA